MDMDLVHKNKRHRIVGCDLSMKVILDGNVNLENSTGSWKICSLGSISYLCWTDRGLGNRGTFLALCYLICNHSLDLFFLVRLNSY